MYELAKKTSRPIIKAVLKATVLLSFSFAPLFGAQEAIEQVRIGVLAKRGDGRCLDMWGPTAEYLTNKIPGYSFTIIPLVHEEVNPTVAKADVDFILANPSIYVYLEYS